MFLIKTKKRAFFSVSTVLLTAYGAFDGFECRRIKKELEEKASEIAKQPIGVFQDPRKVLVYTAPSQYAENTFNKFVKPIFVAGALDFELVPVKEETNVYESIREQLWIGKEEAKTRTSLNEKKTWSQRWFGPRKPVLDPISAFLAKPKYQPSVGIVCIGVEARRQVALGIKDGCLSQRPKQDEPLVFNDTLPPATPDSVEQLQFNTFDLPFIYFIDAENLVGWKNFYLRIYNWFNERRIIEKMGQQALDTVFEKRVALDQVADFELPLELKQRINCK